MKFTSIFFTASESTFEVTSKIRISEREISSLLEYFSQQTKSIVTVHGKDSNKRAKNAKRTLIFLSEYRAILKKKRANLPE